MITLVGLWGKSNLPGVEGDRLLTVILAEHLPPVLGLVLALGLFSAIVSSADTCLMSAASTLENDLAGRRVVKENRLLVLVLGGLAGGIAFLRPGIIPNLMLAYNLFSCGAIPPLAVALLRLRFRKQDESALLHPLAAGAAVVTGGSLGIASSILQNDLLALAGFLLSLCISLAGIIIPRKNP
jgi:SSS family solute:Na+ symporter